jgi:hypothetical protein
MFLVNNKGDVVGYFLPEQMKQAKQAIYALLE